VHESESGTKPTCCGGLRMSVLRVKNGHASASAQRLPTRVPTRPTCCCWSRPPPCGSQTSRHPRFDRLRASLVRSIVLERARLASSALIAPAWLYVAANSMLARGGALGATGAVIPRVRHRSRLPRAILSRTGQVMLTRKSHGIRGASPIPPPFY
jgi:hypothetical protein